ncbi:MAG: DedA family protein [Candidatus Calescibacterium sp.]|nr:DedA family protein [Candidatus Calescibacterium sp.]MCX7734239.1 DedA family protein [bacterium]
MKPIRKLYDWVLSWADKPSGPLVLFVVSTFETFIFPVPPDVLLIALSLGNPSRSLYFAFLCTLSSAIGGSIGYVIGHWFWDLTKDFFLTHVFSQDFFNQVSEIYNKHAFLTLYFVGFTPISDKPFVIGAGVFSVNYFIFLFSYTLSRATRFYAVAIIIRIFGQRARDFIDKYFNILSFVFAILLVVGFVIARYVIKG